MSVRGFFSTSKLIHYSLLITLALGLGACTRSSSGPSDSPSTIDSGGTSPSPGAAAPAVLSFNPGSKAYDTIVVGQSASETFTLSNSGESQATGVYVSASGTGFSLQNNTCGTSGSPVTVAASGSCTVDVVFAPPGNIAYAGSITVNYHDSQAAQNASASLSGSGTNPASLSWSPLSNAFGAVQRGAASSTVTFTLTNTGDLSATGCSAPALSNGTDFKITEDLCGTDALAGGATCTVKVAANPQQAFGSGTLATTLSRTCTTGDTASTTADEITASVAAPFTASNTTIDDATAAAQANKYWILDGAITWSATTPVSVSWLEVNAGAVIAAQNAKAVNISVAGSASIQGTISANGTGTTNNTPVKEGASHGGIGTSGAAIGNPFAPTEFGQGSPGDPNDPDCGYVSTQTFGGGAIHLAVAGTLTFSGTASANGGTGNGSNDLMCYLVYSPAGSGGSVYFETGKFVASGTPLIRASAGTQPAWIAKGSGGGRVAVTYTDPSSSLGATTLQAFGTGTGSQGSIYYGPPGGAGGTLVFDNNNIAPGATYKTPILAGASPASGVATIANVIVKQKALVTVDATAKLNSTTANWTLRISDALNIDGSGAKFYVPTDGTTNHTIYGPWLDLGTATLTGVNAGTTFLEF